MAFDGFDDFDDELLADDPLPATGNADADDEQPQLEYPSVYDYVEEHLIFVYQRKIGRNSSFGWCPQWWLHTEAVSRLEALWRAWESLRLDPTTGMSVWWRDHADHHMAVLMDPDGPFATATEGEENTSKRGEPLPYVAPPEGMFPDVREETDEPPVDDAH